MYSDCQKVSLQHPRRNSGKYVGTSEYAFRNVKLNQKTLCASNFVQKACVRYIRMARGIKIKSEY